MKKRISLLTTLTLLSSFLSLPSSLASSTYLLPEGSNYYTHFYGGISSSGSHVIEMTNTSTDPTRRVPLQWGINGHMFVGFEEKFDGVVFDVVQTPRGTHTYEVSFWDDDSYDWKVLEEFELKNITDLQVYEFDYRDTQEDLMEGWTKSSITTGTGDSDELYFLRFELISTTGTRDAEASQIGIINYNLEIERPYDTDLLEHVNITADDVTLNSTSGDESIHNSRTRENGNLLLAIHNQRTDGHDPSDPRNDFHPYDVTLEVEGHTYAHSDDYEYFDRYMVGYSSRWNDAEVQRTHRINIEDEAKHPVASAEVIAGKNDTECEVRGEHASASAFCALTIAEDDAGATTTVSAPGYVTQTKSIPNRYVPIHAQEETNLELEFAYKIHLENDEGLNLSDATIKMGDDLDITCDYLSGGYYGCPVPVSESDGNIKITHSDYESITTSLHSFKIRSAATDAQSTQDYVMGGEPEPDPSVEGVDLDVDNIYLDSEDELKFRVSNDGDTDVEEDLAVHLKVYVNGDKIYSTNVYNTGSSSWLRAGNSATYKLGDILREESEVRVCVDTEDAVKEDNESNNCMEVELGEDNEGEADLTAVDIELEDDGDLRVTLKNKGYEDVDEDTEVLVYAYLDGRVEWEKEYENDYSASWLNEGEEERIRINDFVEDNDEDEIHSIKVCVDKKDHVDERNEENNCNSVSLRLGEHEDDRDDRDDDEDYTDCGFVDMNRHWASEEVCELVDRDIVQGRSERYYEPNQFVTRAEFLKLLLLTSGREPRNLDGYTFNDVPNYHWAHDYIAYASSLDVARGYGDGSFRPNANVTRGEAVVMIMRIYGEELWGFDENDIIFPDVDRFDWFAYAVILAESYDIVGGYADGTFRPSNELTRAEAAVIMMNMDDSLN